MENCEKLRMEIGKTAAVGTIKNEMPEHILWNEYYFRQNCVVEITMRQATTINNQGISGLPQPPASAPSSVSVSVPVSPCLLLYS